MLKGIWHQDLVSTMLKTHFQKTKANLIKLELLTGNLLLIKIQFHNQALEIMLTLINLEKTLKVLLLEANRNKEMKH